MFTAKDSSGQVVWLEKGNATAGFNHIMKHENDFVALIDLLNVKD